MNVHSSGLAHILLRKYRGSTRTPPNNEMMRSCKCLPRESAISTLTYIWVSMRSTSEHLVLILIFLECLLFVVQTILNG